ncbi:MAG: acyltransferase [Thermoleophilaceae bacterium]|nr:acyltransferase [Thermoleophilaceae bacterium]
MPAALERIWEKVLGLPVQIGYVRAPQLASWLRKRWVLARNPHADIRFHGRSYLGPGFSLHIPGCSTFVVGPGAEFRRNFRAELSPGAKVTIGTRSIFTYDALIQCTTTIDIGERCVFAESVLIVDGSHRFRDITKPMLDQGYDFRPLTIENDALVSAKCTVINSVGERAVIGANSVVTRPIPAFTVAVGAPARPIDYFGPPGAEAPEAPSASQPDINDGASC